eukprot:1597852-Rhodomonas_salina.1
MDSLESEAWLSSTFGCGESIHWRLALIMADGRSQAGLGFAATYSLASPLHATAASYGKGYLGV